MKTQDLESKGIACEEEEEVDSALRWIDEFGHLRENDPLD